jgi:hypothetical protein
MSTEWREIKMLVVGLLRNAGSVETPRTKRRLRNETGKTTTPRI